MKAPQLAVGLLCVTGRALAAQSVHLSALESSVPAQTAELTAGVFPGGIATTWVDPTLSPRATGLSLALYQSSYVGVRLMHVSGAFKAGPRWSLAFASTEIRDLFDTSLLNQDPGLANLRARAIWLWLDATIPLKGVTGSVGLGFAGDENVGDVKSSTVVRAHLRTRSLLGDWLSLGVRASRAVGGSVHADPYGHQVLDVSVHRRRGPVKAAVSAAASRGALWRYSETRGGLGFAGDAVFFSHLEFGVGAGRYRTSFGATSWEWHRSVTAGIVFAKARLGVQYASRRFGLGSGYGVSISYESNSDGAL